MIPLIFTAFFFFFNFSFSTRRFDPVCRW